MTTPTATEVWNALMQDKSFSAQPEAVREAMRPFIEETPKVLADLLDLPVTLSSLMNAKITFLRYAVKNDFIAKIISAKLEESFNEMDAADMYEMMTSFISQSIDFMEPFIEKTQEILDLKGVSEDDLMTSEQVGFNKELKEKYQEGSLIIADVLRQQPAIILKDSN